MSGIDLDAIDKAAAEWWGEGNGVAEAADVIAKVPLLTARVRELEAVVKRLCGCAPDCAERITCSTVGGLGHSVCGWCDDHDRPRHKCGCIVTEVHA